MKTQKQAKAEKSKREDTKTIIVFCYFFATVMTIATTYHIYTGNTTRSFTGFTIVFFVTLFAEKVRRRIKLTLKEFKSTI